MMCMTKRVDICVGIGQIWIDIYSLIWANIEEGETGSGFGTPISVYIFAIPAKISNVSSS